jgi:hypothetical protein
MSRPMACRALTTTRSSRWPRLTTGYRFPPTPDRQELSDNVAQPQRHVITIGKNLTLLKAASVHPSEQWVEVAVVVRW